MNTNIARINTFSENAADMVFNSKVLIVESGCEEKKSIHSKLERLGVKKLHLLKSNDGLSIKVDAFQPDVLIISQATIDKSTLGQLREIKKTCPITVVVFANEYLPEMTKAVLKAGVSSYIVDDVALERLPIIIDLAQERFHHSQSLNSELQHAQQQLSDRKIIEKAKGIIMRKKNVSEDEAYRQIRSSAMNEGKTIAELSSRIISVYKIIN